MESKIYLKSKNDIVFMDLEDADIWEHSGCNHCSANIKLAKKLKARVIINKFSRDIIGVEAPDEE